LALKAQRNSTVLRVEARLRFRRGHRRYRDRAEGGEIADRLDRFLGLLVVRMGYEVVTARLDVRYRKPLSVGVAYPVRVEYRRRGQAHILKAFIMRDSAVAVEASAIYLPFGGREDGR